MTGRSNDRARVISVHEPHGLVETLRISVRPYTNSGSGRSVECNVVYAIAIKPI